ncbi:uncharacterized protein LOC111268908 [Varroa jacobsoni]|uniref:uncharacterized protein LOC111268908 n=1 Tax=Varroa jacobsoni TaxID=62625 RepID=UPI000BF5236D|nr:uncharacterized protein LOC111268908 [Varroa jacobsoni]XP_022703863.1 uncharacterized protein LOC111268908 [Varroa jacobsoni]XP_022703866.1 uncharacterized protein LOC111268908 [Varroa jacobsoni]
MVEEDENALRGFEDRLQKAISDLEDALLGVSDKEILKELQKKHIIQDDKLFCSFKDKLKQASCYQPSKCDSKNSSCNSTEDDVAPYLNYEKNSSNLDLSISSYLKIPISDKLASSATPVEEIPTIRSDFESSTENSDSDFPLENLLSREDLSDKNIQILSGYCRSPLIVDELIESNPELPQPFTNSDFTTQRLTAATNGNLRPRTGHKKKWLTLTENRTAAAGHETIEQFVRRICSSQLDLIDSLSTRPRNVWAPTKPRCSPQVRYQQYRQFWDKFPEPGAKPRKALRWAIRSKMAQKEEPQKISWWPELKL